jgi:hypothetical protein
MNKPTVLLLAAATLLGACTSAPPPVHAMQNPDANFGSFKTFGWRDAEDSAGQTVSILDSNIRDAIATELLKKGYAPAGVGEHPDLVLHYETAAAEKAKANPVRISVGVGGAGPNGAAGVGATSASHKIVREGTLVLSIIDPVRRAEVWNGRVSREVASGGTPNKALIQNAAADLLKDFPARAH